MKKLTLLLLAIFLLACSSEEKIIDNSNKGIYLISASDGELPVIARHNIQTGSLVSEDLYFEANNKSLDTKVAKIAAFKSMNYILLPELNRLLILNGSDRTEFKTLDFSEKALQPVDICFPNATDAYLLCKDKVIIIDLTVYEPAIEIDLGTEATRINCIGNQVFTANTSDNSITFLDTRTKGITNKIDISDKPVDIEILPDGERLGILCAGNGKLEEGDKSSAYFDIVDIATQSILEHIPLDVNNRSSVELFPKKIVSTPKDWAFIVAKDVFFRVDLKNTSNINFISQIDFSDLIYDNVNQILILNQKIGENQCRFFTADQNNGIIQSQYDYNQAVISFIRE